MPDPFTYASEEAQQAREAVNNATEQGQRVLNEALGVAERTIDAATKAAERVLKESLDALSLRMSAYTDDARGRLEEGQRYVVEHVRQRPLTATIAGLSLGLMLGLLLSRRSK